MAEVIGLIYGHNENWIAGSYYIQNLVHALNLLPDKPSLKIYSESEADFNKLKNITGYPDLKWVELRDKNNIIDKGINKISTKLTSRHAVVRGIDRDVDVLFPATDTFYFDKIRTKLFWIPDFQEKHYPKFFSAAEVSKRKSFQRWLVENNYPVVFSSNHSSEDFYSLYPDAKNQTFVMPFAVTLPDFSSLRIEDLKTKFNISGSYFICSNQFWAHKNHITVLKALALLIKQGSPVTVLFTGKPYDNRNPDYYASLEKFVNEHHLGAYVKFLGFIERTEQLLLMKNSHAIIQPSLFEGWSTVVEDAKALGVPVIVSDIPVHREQLPEYPLFFPCEDSAALAELMVAVIKGLGPKASSAYDQTIREFGEKFRSISRSLHR